MLVKMVNRLIFWELSYKSLEVYVMIKFAVGVWIGATLYWLWTNYKNFIH